MTTVIEPDIVELIDFEAVVPCESGVHADPPPATHRVHWECSAGHSGTAMGCEKCVAESLHHYANGGLDHVEGCGAAVVSMVATPLSPRADA